MTSGSFPSGAPEEMILKLDVGTHRPHVVKAIGLNIFLFQVVCIRDMITGTRVIRIQLMRQSIIAAHAGYTITLLIDRSDGNPSVFKTEM